MIQKILKLFKSILDGLEKVLIYLCILLFAVVVTLYAVEIFTRYFLSYSSTVSGELGLILMTWMYFLGFVILFKRGEDVIMEFFYQQFSRSVQMVLDWLTHICIFIFLSVLVWKSSMFYSMTSFMEHPFLPIRYSYTVQPIFVGSVLALIVSIYFVLEKTQNLLKWQNSVGEKS